MSAAMLTSKKLKAACDDTVVGMMLTNPNTLGMFDENIEKVSNW
jgi:glycine dehydrogenase subunit 2